MSGGQIPENLLRAVESDLRPVRPLPTAWRRTLWAAAAATIVLALSLATVPLRSDMGQIPLWLSWGSSAFELLVGLALVCLALREAVPGRAIPGGAATAALAIAMLVQVLVGLATWLHSPGSPLENALATGVGCMKHDTTMALPTFIVTLWLIFRALPTRSAMAGMLGGAGAAITADAVSHLLCPFSDLRHVLVWHTGTIILFMIVGWAVGAIWERLRWRR